MAFLNSKSFLAKVIRNKLGKGNRTVLAAGTANAYYKLTFTLMNIQWDKKIKQILKLQNKTTEREKHVTKTF